MFYNDYILMTIQKQRQTDLIHQAEQARLITAIKDARQTQTPPALANIKEFLTRSIDSLSQRVAQGFRQAPERASGTLTKQCIGGAASVQPAAVCRSCS